MQCVYLLLLQTLGLYLRSQVLVLRMVSDGVRWCRPRRFRESRLAAAPGWLGCGQWSFHLPTVALSFYK